MARTKLYPPSVDPGFPELPPTPAGWVRATFGDALEIVERPIKLEANSRYKLLTAKRSRGGITLRGELLGSEVLTKTQFRVKAGDFVISRRQIIHGACGAVPPDLDGAVVSNEYSALRARPGILMDFLRHYSHTRYFQRTCFHSSHGVDVEKMIFKIDEWLKREIDLPPIPEQQKIAAILSSVNDVIEKTEGVIEQLQVVKNAMMQELLMRGVPGRHTRFKKTQIGEIPETWQLVSLGEVLEDIDAGWSPQCIAEPPDEAEWGVLKVSAVTSGTFRQEESKRLPSNLSPRTDIEVHPRDVILARANGVLELVGKTVFVESTRPRLMLSDKLLRLRPRLSTLDPYFLHCTFQSEQVRSQLLSSTGGSHMRNISQTALRSIQLPLPSLGEQQEIAASLRACEARLSSETSARGSASVVKSALVSALLTGELRVTPEEEAA